LLTRSYFTQYYKVRPGDLSFDEDNTPQSNRPIRGGLSLNKSHSNPSSPFLNHAKLGNENPFCCRD